MKLSLPRLSLLAILAIPAHADITVRLLLGVADTASTNWDGSIEVRGGRIARLEGWRFEGSDGINGSSWKISTRPIRQFGGEGLFGNRNVVPVGANGLVVVLADASDNTRLEVKTSQGDFTVNLSEIPFGRPNYYLNRKVWADRASSAAQLTRDAEEQDYPAAALRKDGSIDVAYLEFQHSKDHNQLRANLKEAPKGYKQYAAPTGGDRILLARLTAGRLGDPVAITPPGGDVYRPAVAVDGAGRTWVFWSQNEKGNFDLFARPVTDGSPGPVIRITRDAGSDIDPAAATDSEGNVWVAWQGWRNGKGSIFAAKQQGNAFSATMTVATSKGNEWNPAIAADARGNVTVAWDSYRAGNYDIFLRTATAGKWGAETAVAATPRYEAHPAIAYEPGGRLWMAYEEGGERWGKNFGAQDTSGVALYQGRAIRLRGIEPGGRVVSAKVDPGTAMPGVFGSPLYSGSPEAIRVDQTARQNDTDAWLKPDPQNAKTRVPNRDSRQATAPRNSLPRITVDPSGRIWLAFRSIHPFWWNPLGTVWTEYVVSGDGNSWTGPVFLPHSDNLLDNRPAILAAKPGELTVIGSADGRRQYNLIEKNATSTGLDGAVITDPYNNDLWANVITLPAGAGQPAVVPAQAAATAAADPLDAVELGAVSKMRSHRSGNLKLLRGEFHRHSDVSMDGARDGSLLDQWRYMMDTSYMDWTGCCDHDNGGGREYSWWISQKLTDIFYTPGRFVPMFSYERSVSYPEGHRNVLFVQRGVRPLPRLPITRPDEKKNAPDTQMLYAYLREFDGVAASHTSGTLMGTDWRDNDPVREPMVEIYQGDRQNYEMPGAPRANEEKDSIGGWRPLGFINLALEMGYKLGFQASSDHVSTHMSYCNIYAADSTREALLDAVKKRHLYAATENILADVRSGPYMMGDAFSTNTPPSLDVKLAGTAPFAKVHIIKDSKYVYTISPGKAEVKFSWRDNAPTAGKTSYYYVRGEQQDGELVWVSPMWITYTGK